MKTRSFLRTAAAWLLLAAALWPAALAQQMNYQGRLTDSSGNILPDGQYTLTFELFDDPTVGTPVWGPFLSDGGAGDGHGTKADLVNGRFNVILGPKDAGGRALAASFVGGSRYLQITVAPGSPLLPRQQILSAPEALHAVNADHATLADGISGNLNVTGDFGVGGASAFAGKITAPAGFHGDVNFDASVVANTLDFGSNSRQMINLYGTAFGIGVQTGTEYFRTGTGFAWYRGGVHNNTANNAGAGGKALMTLDGNGLSVYGENAWTASFSNPAKGANVSFINWGTKGDWYIRSAANDGTVVIQDSAGPVAVGGPTSFSQNVTFAARVGIGNGTPNFPLHVRSSVFYTYPGGVGDLGNYSGGVFQHGGFANASYSIMSETAMLAPSFQATSDRRLKKNIAASDTAKDLETIQKLAVSEYQLVDRNIKGDAFQKGFIAQEVSAVIPEAVSAAPNYLPDIFAQADGVQFDKTQKSLAIKLNKTHALKVGDRVRLIGKTNELELTISGISSDREFVVGNCEADPGSVFVYGKWVPDVLNVNYDRIFTTGIGAIQELARRVKTLEENQKRLVQVEAKAARVDDLEREVAELRTLFKALARPNEKQTAQLSLK